MNREELRDKLIEEAWEGLKNSYSPYSKFPVGDAVMGADGTVYRGCNIENVSYGLTVCGERTAIFNMVAHGCKTFTALAVVSKGNGDAAPCGACRQVLGEFCENLDTPVYIVGGDGKVLSTTVGEIMPYPFLKFEAQE